MFDVLFSFGFLAVIILAVLAMLFLDLDGRLRGLSKTMRVCDECNRKVDMSHITFYESLWLCPHCYDDIKRT